MREKLYNLIEPKSMTSIYSIIYDVVMVIIILLSFVPLVFKENRPVFQVIDHFCVTVFIIDYFLRWITADFRFKKKSIVSFIRYPFSFMAIVDLLSILPSFFVLHGTFKTLRIFRLLKTLRVLRVVRIFRYSSSLQILKNVFYNHRISLLFVCMLAVGYVFVTALVMFQVEPDTFENFFDAVYWSTVSVTTIGYGDIIPVSTVGKVITVISALVGVAIIALPTSIITAGYMQENRKIDEEIIEKRKGD